MLPILAFVLILGWLAAILRLTEVYRDLPKPGLLAPGMRSREWPTVSVIVPARNEETNLGPLLESVLTQDYPNFEVIILNDNSTDRTADIVRQFQKEYGNLRLENGSPLPAGWAGKVHACRQAAALARGDWLLFLDADIRLERGCLKRSLAFAEEARSDLFTIIPRLIYQSVWEAMVQPIMALGILLGFPAKAINDPSSPIALANGPFLLFRRTAYEAIGGHAGLQGVVVEDLVLAQRIKEKKLRLTYGLGTELARLGMYTSLRSLWNGWSRNIYAGLEKRIDRAVAAAVAILLFLLLPPLVLLIEAGRLSLGSPLSIGFLALWVGVILTIVTCRFSLRVLFGLGTDYIALFPLGALIVLGLIAYASWKGVTGRSIPWRGRDYSAAG